MKRTAGTMVLLAALGGGCVTTGQDTAPWNHAPSGGGGGCPGCGSSTAGVPGMQGPWGQPVAMAFPYSANPNLANGSEAAKAMLAQSMPVDLVQQASFTPNGPTGILQAGGAEPPGPPSMAGGPGCAPGAVAAIGALTGPLASPFP